MKITDKENIVKFKDIELGEVFRYSGEVYIKTHVFYDKCCVNLLLGTFTNVMDDWKVEILDAELHIK